MISRMKRFVTFIAAATLLTCSSPAPDVEAPRAAAQQQQPAPAPKPALSQRCTNEQHGYTVSYPAGWHTNDGSVIPACSAFDPRPVAIPRESEIPFELSVVLNVQQMPMARLGDSSQWERVLSAERTTIGGRPALRVETEATGEGLAERGMRTLRYAIDLGAGRTLIASTHDANPAYAQNKDVLAAMIQTVAVR